MQCQIHVYLHICHRVCRTRYSIRLLPSWTNLALDKHSELLLHAMDPGCCKLYWLGLHTSSRLRANIRRWNVSCKLYRAYLSAVLGYTLFPFTNHCFHAYVCLCICDLLNRVFCLVVLIEVLAKVRTNSEPPFRPKLPTCSKESPMVTVMTSCWSEAPEERPSFDDVKKEIKRMNRGR